MADGDFGPYQAERLLASGEATEVWGARRRGAAGNVLVALKRARPDRARDPAVARAIDDEARVLARLDHPNVVRPVDHGRADGVAYLATAYVEGADLARVLREARACGEAIPAGAAAHVGASLCAALAHVHSRTDAEGRPLGLVHRDVAPANVLVSRAGEVVLADFDLAATPSESAPRAVLVRGTHPYLAPEQAWGDPVDCRADVFGVGAVLCEMLAGAPPWGGEDPLARARGAKLVARLGKSGLDAIIAQALAPRRADRFAGALALGRALDVWLAGRAAPAAALARLVPR